MGEARIRGTKEQRTSVAILNKAILDRRVAFIKNGNEIALKICESKEEADEIVNCADCGDSFYKDDDLSFDIDTGTIHICPSCAEESFLVF